MPKKSQQLSMFPKEQKAYGGELLKTRKGRAHGRPLATKTTMHLVLRASRARGAQSFRRPQHAQAIQRLTRKFAERYGVKILKLANVGNHLHFQIKLSNRHTYRPFIRALTAAIAMAVSGACRARPSAGKFWDYRPFTRIVTAGRRAYLTFRDYFEINELEGHGISRAVAERIVYVLERTATRPRPG